MTKTLSPNSSEINPVLITDEEIAQFENIYTSHVGSIAGSYRAALADFLNNRPELRLGRLRPIAEMSDKPANGCFRQHYRTDSKDLRVGVPISSEHHWAIDILELPPKPAPEAEDRQEFEEAVRGKAGIQFFERNQDGSYGSSITEAAHTAWKACKELTEAK